MRPLNYVCAFFQPIIPLVYDNTMTLVECVNKLRYKVNEMIAAYNKVLTEMQVIDGTTKAAEEAAAFVLEYAKLPHIKARRTFQVTIPGDAPVQMTQLNTLYSDNIQVIDAVGAVDADITAGQTFIVDCGYPFNALTGNPSGFTAKLAENVSFEDEGSTYGGNTIQNLGVEVEILSRDVDPTNHYPSVRLKFSSTVNHVKGKIYIHSTMKAGA